MNDHTVATRLSDTRRSRVLEMIESCGEFSVEELAKTFDVSGMTIRRDLQQLADNGRVIRTHGGAAPGDSHLVRVSHS